MVLNLKNTVLDFLESHRERAFTVKEISALLGINPYIIKRLMAELDSNGDVLKMGKRGLVFTYTARMVPEVEC